jgi:hypothetical protein
LSHAVGGRRDLPFRSPAPVVIKEAEKDEKDVVVKNDHHTIYREKKNPDESYTDFEELKS